MIITKREESADKFSQFPVLGNRGQTGRFPRNSRPGQHQARPGHPAVTFVLRLYGKLFVPALVEEVEQKKYPIMRDHLLES